MAPDDVLAQAIDGVADGVSLNWRVLQDRAGSDEERAALEWLQVLGRIADVHRSTDEIVSDESVMTRPVEAGTAPADSAEAWGRYRLVRQLGSGGFGSVHCAWDPELERHVAIKILHQQVADDRLKQGLLREGRALAKVRHANVVQVFGVEAHGDRVGLCMELVSGETLSDALRTRGLMSHREASLVGEDVCRALAAVHRAGYVHRDVKAQNVMRDTDGKIILMDFGTGQDVSGTRRPRDVVGTPVYMAPEVLDGQPASVQSDIYAVGVLLYHLVTGHYPVEGATVPALVDAHKTGRRRALVDRRPDLPLPFVQVVSRALAANPADRWPSAGEMLEALGGLRGEHADDGDTWPWTIARAAGVVVGGVVGVTLLGMVSSRYFNVTLGREAFANEGLRDWLYWGAVSLVAPAILVLMVLVGLAVLRVALRLLLRLWPGGRRLVDALPHLARRLGLDDLETASAAALVTSVGVLAGACWLVSPQLGTLIGFISPNIASAPPDRLVWLSSQFEGEHENYRLAFEWASIIIVAVWWMVFRMARTRRLPLNRGMLAAAAATLALTVFLLDFPFRLLYQADFEVVNWQGRQCYVLGARVDDSLLFCPDLAPPRNRVVRNDDRDLQHVGSTLNPFGHASLSPTERP